MEHLKVYLVMRAERKDAHLRIWKATGPYIPLHLLTLLCVCAHVCGCAHSCMCTRYRIWSWHIVITSANTGLERVDWSHLVGQTWEKMRSDRPHNTAWDVNNSPPPPSPSPPPPPPSVTRSFFPSIFVVEMWMMLQGFWKREGQRWVEMREYPRFHL